MTSTNWTLSNEQNLAEYVPVEDFKGILQQRIGISPDHAALLMRDGKIVDVFTGGHFAVGGVWQRLKEVIGGKHAIRLLVADLKPFQIEGEVTALSKDSVPVAASIAIEFQVNPERPKNVLGLLQGLSPLTKYDVYQRLRPHLEDRVFAKVLKKADSSEIRGNSDLQDRLQADIMQEAERLFGDLGLLVRAASLSWGLNEEERATIQRRKDEREQQQLDYDFNRKKQALQREGEAKEFALQTELSGEKVKIAAEDELRRMVLLKDLDFIDTRDGELRTQEMKQLNHDIDRLNTERRAAYTASLENAQNEVERAQIRNRLVKLDLEAEEMKTLQRLQLGKLEREQELAIAARARQQQLDSMRGLNQVELDKESQQRQMSREDRIADHQLNLQNRQFDSASELEKLRAQASMTPEQILAINAGLSPAVANIFSERARADGTSAEKQQALLREMVELSKEGRVASEAQARDFFDKAMQGVAGVNRNPVQVGAGPVTADASSAPTECAECHRPVPPGDRFCRFCGHQMRT